MRIPDDEYMSRAHFMITREADTFFIHDLQSTNGTQVNGRSVSAQVLLPNDRIVAGQTLFALKREPSADGRNGSGSGSGAAQLREAVPFLGRCVRLL